MFIATIGFFDGVHIGHQCLIEQLRNQAHLLGKRSMVISFDNHPREVVKANYVPELLTLAKEKEELLQQTGVDSVNLLHFTQQTSQLSSQQFMQLLHEQYGVTNLLMGYDHHFGHDCGTFDEYVQRGKAVGVEVLLAHELEGTRVNSGIIRQLIKEGNVSFANTLLSRPYRVEAEIVHGYGIGRTLGFPTANLQWASHKLMPQNGVYAVQATLQDDSQWNGMLNIGTRPTIDNGEGTSIEVHLLDFQGDLYGQRVKVDFIARIRNEQRYDSQDALKEQLQHDVLSAQRLIKLQQR